ncbi:hypothetical protein Tco_1236964 [Tanacetum coccineum]
MKATEDELHKIIHGRGVGGLPSFTETNSRGLTHAITTRSGLNYNPPKNPLEEINDTQNKTIENISTQKEVTPESQGNITETFAPPIPFPRRLKKEKEKEQFQKFFENLQRLSINIPFIEALEQMPKYAKFMKDLLTQRGRGFTKPTLFAANMFEGEKPSTKLKDLPSHLEYDFLGNNQEFLVIISSLLSTQEKELLLEVLTKHKSALPWKVEMGIEIEKYDPPDVQVQQQRGNFRDRFDRNFFGRLGDLAAVTA